MRSRIVSPFIAASLAALSLPAFSQATCREGYVLDTVMLPNGRVQSQCLPQAAIDGRSHANPRSPIGAPRTPPPPPTCPCFTAADVQAAIAAAPFYNFRATGFHDAAGNLCSYRQLDSIAGMFISMVKPVAPTVPCVVANTPDISPEAVNPNGCFSQDQDGSVLLNPISVGQAQACSAILGFPLGQ